MEHIHVKNTVMPVVAVTDSGIRCHVYVLDMYMKQLPPEAFTQDNFYVQPCVKIPDDATNPGLLIGKNTLAQMVKEI